MKNSPPGIAIMPAPHPPFSRAAEAEAAATDVDAAADGAPRGAPPTRPPRTATKPAPARIAAPAIATSATGRPPFLPGVAPVKAEGGAIGVVPGTPLGL